MPYKKSIQIYFYTLIASSFFIIIGFYIYDPLQIFHEPWGRDTTFNNNMRLQAAGIANNYTFDSLIIGSSILENTSSQEANDKLNGNFINISLSGSSYYERLLIMQYFFKKHSIKKVIFSLDAGSYIHQTKDYPKYPLYLFDYLYDDSKLNDYKAYLTYDFLGCLLTYSQDEQCIGRKTTLDRPNSWFMDKRIKERYGGLDKWFESENNNKRNAVYENILFQIRKISKGNTLALNNIDLKILKAKQYVNTTVINFVKQNPNTEFIMIFPPYARIEYALWAQYNLPYFEIHKAMIEYFTIESEKLPNLKIFAFGDQNFLDNINYYKDTRHYHVSINSWMLSQIQNNLGLLESKKLYLYLQKITKKSKTYNFDTFRDRINIYLNNHPSIIEPSKKRM